MFINNKFNNIQGGTLIRINSLAIKMVLLVLLAM
jgi:hypothetical protein